MAFDLECLEPNSREHANVFGYKRVIIAPVVLRSAPTQPLAVFENAGHAESACKYTGIRDSA